MALKNRSSLIKSLIVPALVLGVLLSGCETAATDTSSESSETETSVTETVAPTTSETTTETTTEATTESTSDEREPSTSDDESSTDETSEEPQRDIGYGSYGFLIGDMRFHSKNDISMMICQEDATVYDFGAKKKCDWIDAYYINTEYDMKAFDASYRFLGFFNNETSVNFDPSVEIGPWTTPKGSNLDLYVAEITIISRNLVIKLCPKYPNNFDYYNVSICGRGYYCSVDQLQMMDFFLSYLQENPGVDPLEGIIEAEDHTYYF